MIPKKGIAKTKYDQQIKSIAFAHLIFSEKKFKLSATGKLFHH
jgi:hypothetical protein